MSLAHSRIREREREREEEKEEEGKPYTHLLNGIPDAMPPGREYTYTRSRERRGRGGGGGESIFGGSPCCSHKHTQQTLLLLLRISLDSCVLWYHHTREARGEERRLFPIPPPSSSFPTRLRSSSLSIVNSLLILLDSTPLVNGLNAHSGWGRPAANLAKRSMRFIKSDSSFSSLLLLFFSAHSLFKWQVSKPTYGSAQRYNLRQPIATDRQTERKKERPRGERERERERASIDQAAALWISDAQ